MAYFEDLYQRLFTKQQKQPQLSHEVIRRSDKYSEGYRQWCQQNRLPEYLDKYQKGYHYKKLKIQSSYDVHLFTSSMANGFALSYNLEIAPIEFQYLFDYLAERVLTLKYKKANSDIMISEKGEIIETKEKHYLKPVSASDATKVEQHYGNVLIEYIRIDDQPSYIKVMASTYADQLYAAPLDFDELVDYLFSFESNSNA
ncbi:MAG: hypothetical protein RIF33_21460 [Cyclobacteriaceae bacterium]